MAMTAQDYKIYKSLDPSELNDEERKDLIDYERAEAKAPSIDDVQWATDIHNMASKNPSTLGRELKESGDYQKALDILNADRAYTATLGPNTQNAYVQPVKRIPDDLNSKFNFNWKSAYENVKGEKLRDTEADYDKLQKFIDSQMYKEGDNANLRKIAYDLHMFNDNTMKWSDFINSEQGKEFKKMIKDVAENQRQARIKDIFENESNALVDFGLPVSKAYAQQQLLEGKDPKMGLPIAADLAANAFMFGGNKPAMIAAPTITNVGEGLASNEELPVSLAKAALGVGTNLVAPRRIERAGRWFVQPGEGYGERKAMQETVDLAARKVADVEDRLNKGAALGIKRGSVLSTDDALKAGEAADEIFAYKNVKDKIIYTDEPLLVKNYIKAGYKVRPKKEVALNKYGVVPYDEFKRAETDEAVLRHLKSSDQKATKQLSDARYRLFNGPQKKIPYIQKTIDDAFNKYITTGHLDKMTVNELYALGYKPKESFINFVMRKSPQTLKNYGTNFMGRRVSGAAAMQIPQMLLGVDFNTLIKEKKKKPLISEIFGPLQDTDE